MKYIITLSMALLLTSCVTPEERARLDNEECLAMGFQEKSDQMANCRLQLNLSRKHRKAMIGAANLSRPVQQPAPIR